METHSGHSHNHNHDIYSHESNINSNVYGYPIIDGPFSRDHKDLWWKLLYSLVAVTAAGYLYAKRSNNKLFHCIKPIPVIILGYIVLLWCSVHSQTHYLENIFHLLVPHNPTDYAIYISVGLFLSGLGDFFLIFKRFLVIGVLFFLAAHLSFILAFTAGSDGLWTFFSPPTIIFLLCFNLLFVYLFITKVIPVFIKDTPIPIVIALFFYTSVIVTMCYTATVKSITRLLESGSIWSESNLSATLVFYACCGAIGAVLFFISDIMILVREYNHLKQNQVSLLKKFMGNGDIGMITYWLGQFMIALSVTTALS